MFFCCSFVSLIEQFSNLEIEAFFFSYFGFHREDDFNIFECLKKKTLKTLSSKNFVNSVFFFGATSLNSELSFLLTNALKLNLL